MLILDYIITLNSYIIIILDYIVIADSYMIVRFIYYQFRVKHKLGIKRGEDRVGHISNLISTLNEGEKQEILEKLLNSGKEGIPISVFKADISCLEIIVKYLREAEKKSFREISKILNRKTSTIYSTYSKSKIKFKGKLDISDASVVIPYKIFANRKYSVLESLVAYLKGKQKLSFTQISLVLNKHYSTIKTVYRRYKMKNG
ncbi:hypothetical protein KY347_04125 [Candidatus Woesearchaeota archaeon]|nr:hypothetical protein [Candidatus Woesearchaeota archaeon]